jgi:putative peptidoglycan lipid II flippase
VPVDLDDIAWRALHPSVPHALETPQAVAEALDQLDARRTWPSPEPVQRLPWRALGIALVFMLVLTGVGLVGWQVWQDRSRTSASDTPSTRNPDASGTASTSPSATPAGEVLPIQRAKAFDPSGDGEENDEEAPLAIDGNSATAWQTLTYASRDLGQLKPGVGLQLKLSGEQAVGGIELELVGRGTDLQIWAQRDPTATPTSAHPLAGFRLLASVPGAGDQVTYRFEPAVQTQVVVVWLTALPADGTGYQGGVADVALLS